MNVIYGTTLAPLGIGILGRVGYRFRVLAATDRVAQRDLHWKNILSCICHANRVGPLCMCIYGEPSACSVYEGITCLRSLLPQRVTVDII